MVNVPGQIVDQKIGTVPSLEHFPLSSSFTIAKGVFGFSHLTGLFHASAVRGHEPYVSISVYPKRKLSSRKPWAGLCSIEVTNWGSVTKRPHGSGFTMAKVILLVAFGW